MRITVFLPLLLMSPLAFSMDGGSSDRETETVISGIESTTRTEINENLTAKDRSLARQWQLSESDWVKYKRIMSGPRGTWSPGLDPITALGVSETDPRERERYANLWIQMESRRAELEIAFEVERQRAASRVLGQQMAVNNTVWIEEWESKRSALNQQVMLFVDADCREDCKAKFEEVKASVGDNARLDIFFPVGTSTDAIGEWASFMKIPPAVVRLRKITLNLDEGKSLALDVDLGALPQVRVADLNTGSVLKTF